MSLNRLSGNALVLQTLLAFLDPDGVDESVLMEGLKLVGDPRWEILSDEME